MRSISGSTADPCPLALLAPEVRTAFEEELCEWERQTWLTGFCLYLGGADSLGSAWAFCRDGLEFSPRNWVIDGNVEWVSQAQSYWRVAPVVATEAVYRFRIESGMCAVVRYRSAGLTEVWIKAVESLLQKLLWRLETARHNRDEAERREGMARFFSIVAHELKNPLTALRLKLNMLSQRLADPERAPRSHDQARILSDESQKELDRMLNLIRRLLDPVALSEGRHSVQFKKENLGELVRLAVVRSRELIERSRCTVRLDFVPDAWLDLDRLAIDQLLSNLLENACKYGGGTQIGVELTERPEHFKLVISDGGRGVEPANREEIFKCYSRLESAGDVDGTGIGLYVVKQVVEAHCGRIWLEGGPDSGSRFCIELPK